MKYDFDLDLDARNSASIILNRIKKNSIVLEFGPANGRMTKYLQNKLNCKVYAVELNKDAAKDASKYVEDIIIGNIEDYIWLEEYGNIKFDYIIFADVLEHLYYPENVLKKSSSLLVDTGSVLLSLPNIAHNSIIMELIKDNFNYSSEGLLDHTHIRFFTKKTLENLIFKSGLNICYQSAVYTKPSNTEFHNSYEELSSSLSSKLKERLYGEVYQFVVEAKKVECKKEIDFDKKQKQILYINTGFGFNEKEKIVSYENLTETLIFTFNVSKYKNISSLMFVPLESELEVNIESIIINRNKINNYTHSGVKKSDQSIVFLYSTPRIILDVLEIDQVDQVKFKFKKIRLINNTKEEQLEDKKKRLHEKDIKLNKKKKQILEQEKQILEQEKQILEQEKQILEQEKQILESQNKLLEKEKETKHLCELNIELENIAQSMRIKSRIKRILPSALLLNNIKQIAVLVKNRRFRELVSKSSKRILPLEATVKHTSICKLNKIFIDSPIVFSITDTIDIVIPVYNGMEYLTPLFDSLFSNTDIKYRLIIVNDASPDHNIKQFILDKINNRNNCFYFENTKNLGFTQTVNFAVTKVTSKFFIILNTDVEVPKKWLSRLILPFYTNDKIASITPFSNSAVFFSYPIMGEDNKLPLNFTLQEIDNAFQHLNPKIDKDCDIHSGVGFCMAINKECWQQIGSFDVEAFGKGYGEENDWCMRAISYGWRNILCSNLFVFHNHGGSFNSDEKKALMKNNGELLNNRWPTMMSIIKTFTKKDPWEKYRIATSLMLSQSTNKCALIIDLDNEKGGAFAYRQNRIKNFNNENYKVLLLTHSAERKEWILSTQYGDIEHYYSLIDISKLKTLLKFINIQDILINNLVFIKQNELFQVFKTIREVRSMSDLKLEYVFHDSLSVCPSFFLMNNDNNFCNIPSFDKCNLCLPANKNKTVEVYSLDKWRKLWKNFLLDVDQLTCFSSSSKDLVLKVYSELNIDVIEHRPLTSFAKKYQYPDKKEVLTIACFGAFSESKGSNQIKELALLLKEKYPNAKILLFGNIYTNIDDLSDNICIMGLYDRDKLPDILIENSVSVVFFASIIPETFSYVVQELMLIKAPIVCFDIGAPAERIRRLKYQPSCIASEISAKAALVCIERLYKRLT